MEDLFTKFNNFNSKVNKLWARSLILFWVLIILLIINVRSNPPSNNLTSTASTTISPLIEQSSVNWKNCIATQNEPLIPNELDTSPLKTNSDKGIIDLVADTENAADTKNAIPALFNPDFINKDQSVKCIKNDEEVFLVNYNNVTKVYPRSVLNLHQIVNDDFDGVKIAVTYSPLSDSAAAFQTDGKSFGVSGRTFAGNTLMLDTDTESLWLQLTGLSVVGDLSGLRLEPVILVRTTFEKAVGNIPSFEVLSFNTGYEFDYGKDPYEVFHSTTAVPEGVDPATSPKSKLLVFNHMGVTRSYEMEEIRHNNVIESINGVRYKAYNNPLFGDYRIGIVDENEEINDIPSVQTYKYTWDAIQTL